MFCLTIPIDPEDPDLQPFRLLREHLLPALEAHRPELEAMYAPNIGRPQTDPVRLMAVTVLKIMQRLPDRACASACRFDARWHYALDPNIPCFHPATLTYFRNRLAQNDKARLQAMKNAGCLKRCKAVRIDSTHLLAGITRMSRLECVRETLRLALVFLAEFGGAENGNPGTRVAWSETPASCETPAPNAKPHFTAAACNLRRWAARLVWEARQTP